MVATTFSTDTPNLVTNMVRENGVADNWLWWSFLLTGMATVFFYARLWRRSKVLTDLEFYEIRYSGKAATMLRGFRAVYLGLFFNCVIMATVNLAAAKIANIVLGWPMGRTLLVCSVITIFFASVSGLWGVLVTDSIQFMITMTGSFAIAYFALSQPAVGGLSGLIRQDAGATPSTCSPTSATGRWRWRCSSSRSRCSGGRSGIPARSRAAGATSRSGCWRRGREQDAVIGTLLFNVMHYALRPWPWILVALCSTLVYPQLSDIAKTFPYVDPSLIGNDMAYPAMLRFLPAGFLGLMIAGMLAAYRSTIETHLNWGTSYLVHDFYRRFLNTGRQRAALRAGRADHHRAADDLRGVADLRARHRQGRLRPDPLHRRRHRAHLPAALVLVAGQRVERDRGDGEFVPDRDRVRGGGQGRRTRCRRTWSLISTVLATTVVWVSVTFLSPPTDRATLVNFYRLVRPAGGGWKPVVAEAGVGPSPDSMAQSLLGWVMGCAFIYSALFGVGSALYGRTPQALMWLVVFGLSGVSLYRIMPKLWGSAERGV